jgi:tetratricopeptide (TPR) repeat protein
MRSLLKFLVIALLLVCQIAHAQDTDSLKQALQEATHDTTRCLLLEQLSETETDDRIWPEYTRQLRKICETNLGKQGLNKEMMHFYGSHLSGALNDLGFLYQTEGETDKALDYYRQGLELAQKINDAEGVAAALNNIGFIYRSKGDLDKALEYYLKSIKVEEQNKFAALDKDRIPTTYNNIAGIYTQKGDIARALEYFNRSLSIREKNKDKKGIGVCLNNIGFIHFSQGDIPKALQFYHRSLRIREELKDSNGMAYNLNNIGLVYYNQGEEKKALDYYRKALKIREDIKDKKGVAYTLNNIGLVYEQRNDTLRAFENYRKSLRLREEMGDAKGMGSSLNSLGQLYFKVRNMTAALENYYRAREIFEKTDDKKGMAEALSHLAAILFKQGKQKEARAYAEQSLVLARELGFPENVRDASSTLSTIYSEQNDWKNAYEMQVLFKQMTDSINNQTNRKAALEKGFEYEYGKKAAADSVKTAEERKVFAAQMQQERTQKMALYIGIALIAVFSLFMYNRFRVTSRQKKLIELKEKETQHQKLVIEEKHKEISDSIHYAERIQRSFLATKEMLDKNLSEYFILFRPKDVVSGDFYWAGELKNGNFAFATADSTGHGVPGAIMSLLNITSLEKAIELHTDPAEILNHTRHTIIDRLKKDGSAEGGKDGMDCSLLVFDKAKRKLLVAAAYNPVWIVRGEELIEVVPDKMPVGKSDKEQNSFTLNSVDIKRGDMIYALTDGFPDQFGGPKGKKFMSKTLKELLRTNATLPIPEQNQLLKTAFLDWIGNLEQVDDVTVVGIRI